MSMGQIYFYTGIPDSKTASLPSCPRKGNVCAEKLQKPEISVKRYLWGGCTAEIKYDKDKKAKR